MNRDDCPFFSKRCLQTISCKSQTCSIFLKRSLRHKDIDSALVNCSSSSQLRQIEASDNLLRLTSITALGTQHLCAVTINTQRYKIRYGEGLASLQNCPMCRNQWSAVYVRHVSSYVPRAIYKLKVSRLSTLPPSSHTFKLFFFASIQVNR